MSGAIMCFSQLTYFSWDTHAHTNIIFTVAQNSYTQSVSKTLYNIYLVDLLYLKTLSNRLL